MSIFIPSVLLVVSTYVSLDDDFFNKYSTSLAIPNAIKISVAFL